MRYTIVPYRDSIKGEAQRSACRQCRRHASSIEPSATIKIEPLVSVVVYDRRVNIVHNDRLRGYIVRI